MPAVPDRNNLYSETAANHMSSAVAGHRRAFGEDSTFLFMIGDPKQAIYGFRGADIFTYLKASGEADSDTSVPSRASAALIEGCCMATVAASKIFFTTGAGVPAGTNRPYQNSMA